MDGDMRLLFSLVAGVCAWPGEGGEEGLELLDLILCDLCSLRGEASVVDAQRMAALEAPATWNKFARVYPLLEVGADGDRTGGSSPSQKKRKLSKGKSSGSSKDASAHGSCASGQVAKRSCSPQIHKCTHARTHARTHTHTHTHTHARTHRRRRSCCWS